MRNLICVGIAAFIIGMLSEYIIVSADNVKVIYSGKYKGLEYHVEEYNEKRKLVIKDGPIEIKAEMSSFYSDKDIDRLMKKWYKEYHIPHAEEYESSFVTFKPVKDNKK